MPRSSKKEEKSPGGEPLWVEGSDNVFKDLGFSDQEAANLVLRSNLMDVVQEIIKENGWTQQEAARRLGVTQPRVSDLVRGHIDLFSVDTLVEWLDRLGKEVQLTVKDKEVA
jgi:predicted XRE-type DNA-binding protein